MAPTREQIPLLLQFGDKNKLRDVAQSQGVSVSRFIRDCLIRRMETLGFDPIVQLPERGDTWHRDRQKAVRAGQIGGPKGGRASALRRFLRDKERPRRRAHWLDAIDPNDPRDLTDVLKDTEDTEET